MGGWYTGTGVKEKHKESVGLDLMVKETYIKTKQLYNIFRRILGDESAN